MDAPQEPSNPTPEKPLDGEDVPVGRPPTAPTAAEAHGQGASTDGSRETSTQEADLSGESPVRLGLPDGVAPILSVIDVRKSYDTSGHRVLALDGVSMSLGAGTFTAIMGASGSGKSTLMHLIGGLLRPNSGEIVIEGYSLGRLSDRERTIFRRRRIGIIFQEYNLLPTLTAWENVALPFLVDGQALNAGRSRVDEMLRLVHLEQRARHRPDALSGGEQQRVAIARALLNDPAIILADEPTGNLDSKQSVEIWLLLQKLAREGNKTILMVTHEAAGAAYADQVVILRDGQIIGTLEPKGSGDAALVATGYQELAG
jgi:putative ABC transport system ATP-binding protein